MVPTLWLSARGYQHGLVDNWKLYILTGRRLYCLHANLSCHGICDVRRNDVTSFLWCSFRFQCRNFYFNVFQSILSKEGFEDVINRL